MRHGVGGARRDRTADLLHAMQALSQLSYSPAAGETRNVRDGPVSVKNLLLLWGDQSLKFRHLPNLIGCPTKPPGILSAKIGRSPLLFDLRPGIA